MKETVRKKLNLLVHLAKIDGKFDHTERAVLHEMLKESGISGFDMDVQSPVNLDSFKDSISGKEILYWALRMIKADGIIHSDESAYCKSLAIKLKYRPEAVDHFSSGELPTLEKFKSELDKWTV